MQPIVIRPKEYYDKPGKHEVITFFKPCKTNCPKCDTKRMSCCKQS